MYIYDDIMTVMTFKNMLFYTVSFKLNEIFLEVRTNNH